MFLLPFTNNFLNVMIDLSDTSALGTNCKRDCVCFQRNVCYKALLCKHALFGVQQIVKHLHLQTRTQKFVTRFVLKLCKLDKKSYTELEAPLLNKSQYFVTRGIFMSQIILDIVRNIACCCLRPSQQIQRV